MTVVIGIPLRICPRFVDRTSVKEDVLLRLRRGIDIADWSDDDDVLFTSKLNAIHAIDRNKTLILEKRVEIKNFGLFRSVQEAKIFRLRFAMEYGLENESNCILFRPLLLGSGVCHLSGTLGT